MLASMQRSNPQANPRPDSRAILAAVAILKAQILAKQGDEAWQTTRVARSSKTER